MHAAPRPAAPTDLPTRPIPGGAAIPLLGARADLLRFFADPLHHLHAMEQRGDVAALTAGDTTLLFAFGAAHNHTVLSDPATFRNAVEVPFPLPPGSAATRMFTGTMSMNGDEHRRHRRLLLPVVSKAAVASYAGDIRDVAERFGARWTGGETFDATRASATLTAAVLTRCLFGAEADDDDGAEIGRISAELLGLFTSPLTILAPWRIPGLPYARFLAASEAAEARMRTMIATRRAAGEERRDVMSILLRAHDEEVGGLTDDQVIAHMVSMLFAGQDTVATTLALTLLLLAQHPDVTGAIGEELDAIDGAPAGPDDLARLPLLDAAVNESMRVLPAIVHLLFRRSTTDGRLGDHVVPAGSTIILSPLVTHHDPAVFPDPLRFDPRRWEGAAPPPYAYLPFGAGPRTCLGAGLASYVIRVVLATVLRGHRPVVAPGTRVDLAVRAANLVPRAAVPIRLVPRADAPRAVAPIGGDIRRLIALPG